MQKSGIVTKINMPNPIVQLCAVVLVGIGVTSTAFGAGFRDGGTSSVYTCRAPNMGTPTGWDQTDWSVPVSGFTGQSDLASDDPIPNCKTTTTVSYYSDRAGFYVGAHKRNTCSACNTGYHLVSHTMPSTSAQDCIVTWEECKKDTPCDGLVCEGKTAWTNVSGKNYQTVCNTGTNKCEYRCKSNYYNAGGMMVSGGAPNCKACPAHADCSSSGYPPRCDIGYYLIDHNYAEATGGIVVTRPKDYECLRCPSIGNVHGTTDWALALDPPKPSFITWCYIPPNTNITVTEGTFQFTKNCPYTEDE